MKRILPRAVLLALLVWLPGLYAAEKQYETGRIVTVEKKFHTRVLYYLGNTPVNQDDSYYELSLRLNRTVYATEYTPRHAADELPDDWTDGAEVQMKLSGKHHMMVRGPGGRELDLLVVKRMPDAPEATSSKPASVQN